MVDSRHTLLVIWQFNQDATTKIEKLKAGFRAFKGPQKC